MLVFDTLDIYIYFTVICFDYYLFTFVLLYAGELGLNNSNL